MKKHFIISILFCLMLCSPLTFSAKLSAESNLNQLLVEKKYQELESEMKKLQSLDFNYEGAQNRLVVATKQMLRPSPIIEPMLNDWLAANEDSPYALMVRGNYFQLMGRQARGTKAFVSTSPEQLESMSYYYTRALTDLEKAKELSPDLLPVYLSELELMNVGGYEKQKIENLTQEALRKFPLSYALNELILRYSEPRWGGSYEIMAKEVARIRLLLPKNANLKSLLHAVEVEKGFQATLDKDYELVVSSYTKALSDGDNCKYLSARGEAYTMLERNKEAIVDLEKAIKLCPLGDANYRYLGRNYFKMTGDSKLAIKYFLMAYEQDPNDALTNGLLGSHYWRLNDFTNAYKFYSQAARLDPTPSSRYLQRAILAKKRLANPSDEKIKAEDEAEKMSI